MMVAMTVILTCVIPPLSHVTDVTGCQLRVDPAQVHATIPRLALNSLLRSK